MTLATVNRTTLREQVLENLRAAILDGTFSPGEKLGEVDLAEQFGVSRGTVREALRSLHNSGLLEGSERNSLRVRRLSAAEIVELYDVRAGLEGQALATILRSPAAQQIIESLERALPEAPADASYAERFEIDLSFHESLCRLSGNAMLLHLWLGIKDLMRVSILASTESASRGLMTKSHHQPIIDALRSGDPSVARAALAEHMSAAAKVWTAPPQSDQRPLASRRR